MPLSSNFQSAIGDVQGRRDDDLYRRQVAYRDQQASAQSQSRWQQDYDLRADRLKWDKDQEALRKKEAGKLTGPYGGTYEDSKAGRVGLAGTIRQMGDASRALPPPVAAPSFTINDRSFPDTPEGQAAGLDWSSRVSATRRQPGDTGDEYDWPAETAVAAPDGGGGSLLSGMLPWNWGRGDANALEGPPPLTAEGAGRLMDEGWPGGVNPGTGSLGGLGGLPQRTAEQRTDELLAEGMGREEIRAILQREGLIGGAP